MDDGMLFTICSILMLPNILFQLVPILMRRNPPPAMSYIFSLILNVAYGCLYGLKYSGDDFVEAAFIMAGFVLFCTIVPFDKICCSSSFQGNHFVFREIFKTKLDRKGFIRDMCGNRALPPLIQVYAEAYHYETRVTYTTTRDSNGNVRRQRHEHREKVVTYRSTKVYKYASWEEKGNSIRIKETDIIHAVCPYSVHLDDQARRELQDLRTYMYNIARTKDWYASVSNTFTVPNLKEVVTGSISGEEPCVINFYQSCGGRFLWFFFFIIGYQSAYEAIWCAQGERMRMKLKKYVSGHKNEYRCEFGAEDPTAAKSTFRFDSGIYELDSSLYTGFELAHLSPDMLEPIPNMPQQGMQPLPGQPGMQSMPAQQQAMQPMPTQQGIQSMPGQQGMHYMQPQQGMQYMPGQQEMHYMQPQQGMQYMQPQQEMQYMQPQQGMAPQMQPGYPQQQPAYPDEINDEK